MTLVQQRRTQAELVQSRKDSGLCINCGDPAALKRDGTIGATCNLHRRHYYNRGQAAGSEAEWDVIDSRTFLDTEEFESYCDLVRDTVIALGRATIGDLRRTLGDDFRDRWIMDALESCCAGRVIRESLSFPTRWEVFNA